MSEPRRIATLDIWLASDDSVNDGIWHLGYLEDLGDDGYGWWCGSREGDVGCGNNTRGDYPTARTAMLGLALHNRVEHWPNDE